MPFFAIGFFVVGYLNMVFLYEEQLIFSGDQENNHVAFLLLDLSLLAI